MTTTGRNDDALSNARNGDSRANYGAIFEGFEKMGIPAGEIQPRVNVYTFAAWKALGRRVSRGQHGVKIHTRIPVKAPAVDSETGEETEATVATRPWVTTVFHVSQTEAQTEALGNARVKQPAVAAEPAFFDEAIA